MYMYAWYEMLGLIMLAGVAVYVLVRGIDLLLEAWLDRRHNRRQRALDEMGDAAGPVVEGFQALADALKKMHPRG